MMTLRELFAKFLGGKQPSEISAETWKRTIAELEGRMANERTAAAHTKRMALRFSGRAFFEKPAADAVANEAKRKAKAAAEALQDTEDALAEARREHAVAVERESLAARREALAALRADDAAVSAKDRRLEALLGECAVLAGEILVDKYKFTVAAPRPLVGNSGLGVHLHGYPALCCRYMAGLSGGRFPYLMVGSVLHNAIEEFVTLPLSQRWEHETRDLLAAMEAEIDGAETPILTTTATEVAA